MPRKPLIETPEEREARLKANRRHSYLKRASELGLTPRSEKPRSQDPEADALSHLHKVLFRHVGVVGVCDILNCKADAVYTDGNVIICEPHYNRIPQ